MANKSKKKYSQIDDSDVDGSEKSANSNVVDEEDAASMMSEGDQFFFDEDLEEDFGASSTQIQPSDKALNLDDQIELLNCLKQHIKPMENAGTTFNRTLKRIKWNEIKITGYTSNQLKNAFMSSIKPVKKVRTLLEVITDLEQNDAKYKRATHQDFPKKPFSPFMLYQTEYRDKLIKGYQKKHNDSTKVPSLGELAKFCSEKFRELPPKKIAMYNDRYKDSYNEYREKLESFYVAHPELRVVIKSKSRGETKMHTPLNFFVEKMQAESATTLHRNDLMKNWKEMSDLDKAPFIRAVAEDFTSLKTKKLSKEEQKILDTYNGIPARPLHPFNEFIKYFQKNYSGESKERFRLASVAWKNMDAEDKQKYFDKAEANTEAFRADLEKYVLGFPVKEREETWNKLRLSKKMKMTNLNDSLNIKKEKNGDSSRAIKDESKVEKSPEKFKKVEESSVSSKKKAAALKQTTLSEKFKKFEDSDDSSRKRSASSALKAPASPEKSKKVVDSDDSSRRRSSALKAPASPEKSKKVDESDDSTSKKRQKKKLYSESEEDAQEAKKKFKSEKETTTDSDSRSSPKKKKKMAVKMLEPSEFPSQTKQHYFLTHVYKGPVNKPDKINAAWVKLSKTEKKKIAKKVEENQKVYLQIVKDFVANNERSDVEIFRKIAKNCQSEQNKAIAWYKDTNSDSSSNESDDDSDSS
ncbi:unnamed protein product [Diamesa tonsa]